MRLPVIGKSPKRIDWKNYEKLLYYFEIPKDLCTFLKMSQSFCTFLKNFLKTHTVIVFFCLVFYFFNGRTVRAHLCDFLSAEFSSHDFCALIWFSFLLLYEKSGQTYALLHGKSLHQMTKSFLTTGKENGEKLWFAWNLGTVFLFT